MNWNQYLFILLLALTWGCNSSSSSDKEKALLQEELNQLQSQLAEAKDVKKDLSAAKTLIEKSQIFATQYTQDTLAPVYLFRAADVARGIGEHKLAVDLWGEVMTKFPDFRRTPDALFLQGFTSDKDLQDKALAQRYYMEFLDKYPGHEFVEDVQLLLQYIEQDKSPEQLVKEFQESQKQNAQ